MSVIGNPITLGGAKGNPEAEENDVIFIDYDGTIRYSYTASEFAQLTELPPNPKHDGLTAQGWNWDLADAKEYVADYGMHIIGQSYITDDGKTRFYIDLSMLISLTITMNIYQSVSAGVTVSWGDGTSETISGTGNVTFTHTYSDLSEYKIELDPSNNCELRLGHGNSTNKIFDEKNLIILKRAELGKNIAQLAGYGLNACRLLSNITIPTSVASAYNHAVSYCRRLNGIVYPSGMALNNASNLNSSCSNLKYASFPKQTRGNTAVYILYNSPGVHMVAFPTGITRVSSSFCYENRSLYRCSIPEGVVDIGSQAFQNCESLRHLIIPSTTTSIQSASFLGPAALLSFKWKASTPPVAGSSNTFQSLASYSVLIVPYASLSAYLNATNYPDPSTYTYLGFATYASGTTLPTQDSTEAYNVTWYASVDDATSGTNPISVGNGNEIYCTYTEVSA